MGVNRMKGTTVRSPIAILAACAALALTAPLGGCASILPPAQVASLRLTNDKTLFVAEQTFAGLTASLNAAVDTGYLHGARAAQAKVIYDQAHDALLAARQAHDLGNAALATTNAQAAIDTGARLAPYLPPTAGSQP